MTPSELRDFETLRVLLWWEQVLVASGLFKPDLIEMAVRDRLPDIMYEKTGNLRAYPRGGRPYRLSKGPNLVADVWPERIQQAWPKHATKSWLATPFWYLLIHRPDSATLVKCIRLLPEVLREHLLEEPQMKGSEPHLQYLIKEVVYDLSERPSPMRLGALACARDRACLSGQADIERLCIVALAWMLMKMRDRAAGPQHALLEHLLDFFLIEAAEYVYSVGLTSPIAASDIERFEAAVEQHQNWTVEAELMRLAKLPY